MNFSVLLVIIHHIVESAAAETGRSLYWANLYKNLVSLLHLFSLQLISFLNLFELAGV